jgi:hypothetical protein
MGDWDCNGAVAPRDGQAVLKHFLNQPELSQTEPCPDIGQQNTVVTSTPGPSPTGTHIPIPTPTPSGAPTVFTQNSSWYFDAVGILHVVGEVVNLSPTTVNFVKVDANAVDSNGQVLDTDYNYACLTAIGPGQVSPFDVMLFDNPVGVAAATPFVTRYDSPPSYEVGPGVTLATTNTYYDNQDVFHIEGTATNNSGNEYDFMKVCSATYDDAGTVMTARYGSTAPLNMPPGKVATFHIRDRDAFARGGTSYTLWADSKILIP